jgi:hypothetical protein
LETKVTIKFLNNIFFANFFGGNTYKIIALDPGWKVLRKNVAGLIFLRTNNSNSIIIIIINNNNNIIYNNNGNNNSNNINDLLTIFSTETFSF